jgi:hypothetical protein
MSWESNLGAVANNLISRLGSLQDADKVLRTAALDTVALISDRIQQKGLKTDGTLIKSVYSVGYAAKRAKKGYQTNFVDLTFTGDMLADYTAVPDGTDSYVAGFRSEKSAQKAEFNEDRFGTVFQASNEEVDILIQGVNESINKIVND